MAICIYATFSLILKINSNLSTSIMPLKSEGIFTLATNPMFVAREADKSAVDSTERLAPSLSNLP